MYRFLLQNRVELLDRCKAKVALRPHRAASVEQLAFGVPLFLHQLTQTFRAEDDGHENAGLRISGASGGDASMLSQMGVSAMAHGRVLLDLGFTIEQVVHDYGDLCQAITDLAVERDAAFSVKEFRTLNRCLDNAIADAVVGFAEQRDAVIAKKTSADENERLGVLVHELRNYLQTATLAFEAIEAGRLSVGGSTAALLKRSLASLGTLLADSLSRVDRDAHRAVPERFSVALLLADLRDTAALYAITRGCTLTVSLVDPLLMVEGNRTSIAAAVVNLLQNAFKFTQVDTEVSLSAHGRDGHVLIAVEDHCGGLPPGTADQLFEPFKQVGHDRSGLGLGLSIARRSVEADGGSLTVKDLPGSGCIFTIELPRYRHDDDPQLGLGAAIGRRNGAP